MSGHVPWLIGSLIALSILVYSAYYAYKYLGLGGEVLDASDSTNGGTTETDYRWKWLSTIWSIGYGLGFPAWFLLDIPQARPPTAFDGTVLGLFFLAWGGTVVYIIGPENIEAWQKLTGGEE